MALKAFWKKLFNYTEDIVRGIYGGYRTDIGYSTHYIYGGYSTHRVDISHMIHGGYSKYTLALPHMTDLIHM